jgi:hypothetical protein
LCPTGGLTPWLLMPLFFFFSMRVWVQMVGGVGALSPAPHIPPTVDVVAVAVPRQPCRVGHHCWRLAVWAAAAWAVSGCGCLWFSSSSPVASPLAAALRCSLACCCALLWSLRMLAAIPSVFLSYGPRSVSCGRCWEPWESFARGFAQLTTTAFLDVAHPVEGVVGSRPCWLRQVKTWSAPSWQTDVGFVGIVPHLEASSCKNKHPTLLGPGC